MRPLIRRGSFALSLCIPLSQSLPAKAYGLDDVWRKLLGAALLPPLHRLVWPLLGLQSLGDDRPSSRCHDWQRTP